MDRQKKVELSVSLIIITERRYSSRSTYSFRIQTYLPVVTQWIVLSASILVLLYFHLFTLSETSFINIDILFNYQIVSVSSVLEKFASWPNIRTNPLSSGIPSSNNTSWLPICTPYPPNLKEYPSRMSLASVTCTSNVDQLRHWEIISWVILSSSRPLWMMKLHLGDSSRYKYTSKLIQIWIQHMFWRFMFLTFHPCWNSCSLMLRYFFSNQNDSYPPIHVHNYQLWRRCYLATQSCKPWHWKQKCTIEKSICTIPCSISSARFV